jgi:hypothetical protein
MEDDAIFGAIEGAEHQSFGLAEIDIVRVGDARMKRSIYPAGMKWSTDLEPLVGTPACMHAHVGFLAHGSLVFEYTDGCRIEATAPAVVNIAPGHDAWVVGKERAVLIEVDYAGDTIARMGLDPDHRH